MLSRQVVLEYLPVVHRLRLYRPRLRSRLTLSGRTFLRNPLAFDGGDSHSALATHTGILSCIASTDPSGSASAAIQRSSTNVIANIPKLRWQVLAPLYLRRTITRPVSYYALFK